LFCNIVILQDTVDGIVAAVENKIILKSDVILNMQLSGVQLSQNSIQLEKTYNDFLNQMINDNILLVAAEKDTNVVVDNNMVDSRLKEYMDNVIKEVGSEEDLATIFNKSIREIKYYYRNQIYDAMLREMYVYNYLGSLDVSRQEVVVFYNTYKDSLPVAPAKYNFSIIEVPVVPNAKEINRVEKTQLELYNRINNGESFVDIAKKYSEDPGTAMSGGDQGYYKKGTLFPEFESAALSLEKNEISKPIRTPVGFHIIKLLDKTDKQIHTQHILSLVNKTKFDEEDVLKKLQKIYQDTKNDPGVFDSLAIAYSKQYDNNSGIYKNIEENKIPDEIRRTLMNSDEYKLNNPLINNNKSSGIIIYPYEISKAMQLTIKNNFEEIELYTKNKKQNDLLNKLIEKLKHKTFIKYYN